MSIQNETALEIANAHFDPETLAVLREVLDDAWALLPPEIMTKTSRSAMATFILREAAKGERDPANLRATALLEIADEFSKNAT